MSGFGNSKTINNESSILNSGTNLVVNSIVTTSPTVPFACGAITVTGDVTSSGDVNIGANTVRCGTLESGFIRCNYMNSPTGETNGPMILDPNYTTNNYVRVQDKLQVAGVSEFLGNMTSTGTLSTTGLITNSIVSTGTTGPLTIDPNFSTNNWVLIHDKLVVNGNFENGANSVQTQRINGYGNLYITSNTVLEGGTSIWASNFYNNSDDRIKTNEVVITNATETLLKLRPETYDKYSNFELTGSFKKESGLVIQEVWNIEELRHLVSLPPDANIEELETIQSTDPNNDPSYIHWGSSAGSLNYNGLIAYLIKGFQEQNQRINELQNRIVVLEG